MKKTSFNTAAWRTISIESQAALSYTEGQLCIKNAGDLPIMIPLFDVRAVIIESLQVSLSAALINELRKRFITLIFCNEKKIPHGELVGYYDHHATPARLRDQLRWKKSIRQEVLLTAAEPTR